MQQPRPFWDLAMMVRVSGAIMLLGLSLLGAIQSHSDWMAHLGASPDDKSAAAQELYWFLFAFIALTPVVIYWIFTGLAGMLFRTWQKRLASGAETPPAARRLPLLPIFFD